MDISIVDYLPKFKPLILDLFKKTFHKEMSKKFWNWKFEENPFGKPIVKLAFYKDQLVGNYILNPLEVIFQNNTMPILQSMTTMTDPDFWGKGISTNLAIESYKIGHKLGYSAIMGFMNINSSHMFIKKLGFSELNIMNEIELVDFDIAPKLSVSEILDFNEIPSNFFLNLFKSSSKLIVNRTSEYLNWRFFLNPETKYFCFKILKNDKICGYFVLKNFDNLKFHIVDFILEDDKDCYDTMFSFSKIFSEKSNISKLTLWTNYKYLENYLNSKKIKKIKNQNFFLVKILNPSNTEYLKNYHNWYITMSDSDVF